MSSTVQLALPVSCRTLPSLIILVRQRLSVLTHVLLPRSAEMHRRGLRRPDHPSTWDIGTACRRPMSANGLVMSEGFPCRRSFLLVFRCRMSFLFLLYCRRSFLHVRCWRLLSPWPVWGFQFYQVGFQCQQGIRFLVLWSVWGVLAAPIICMGAIFTVGVRFQGRKWL